MLNCPIVSLPEVNELITEKQQQTVSLDLLYYQDQEIPYQKENNSFLLPIITSENISGSLTSNYGKVYIISDNAAPPVFSVYVISDTSYHVTSISITSSAVLTFQTEEFENENAYGTMKFFMPDDEEIGTYSFKSSAARLSYETLNGLTTKTDRNYTLELVKGNSNNKMNLAGLRKDDDWELDPLFNCSEQILSFYQEWNNFCIESGQSRFMIYYHPVDFYLDEQFMGNYLLRVPIDDKQLKPSAGTFVSAADSENTLNSAEIHDLFQNTISDVSLALESYFWMESDSDTPIVYSIPRRLVRKVTSE